MSSAHHPSVLILDRDPIHRQRLENALRARAYQASSRADGRAGLYFIDQRPPSLLITEIDLEYLDGFTLAGALKARPETASIPVIFLSARDDRETMLNALQLGAKFFVPKPFSLDDLLAKVERSLSPSPEGEL